MKALDDARTAYNAACEKRDLALEALDEIADDATQEDRDQTLAAFDDAQAEVERCKANVDRLDQIAQARAATPPIEADPAEKREQVKVGKEAATYRPDTGVSFFRDLAFADRDPSAAERLHRHNEETRDISTTATAGGGFVPPIYLGDLWADAPRQGRPFANQIRTLPLPASGMTISIPKVTTAPATAAQTADNQNLQETDLVEATISIEVNTIGGVQDVSMQLLERSDPSIDAIVFQSLRDSYDTQLDTYCLSGTGSNGQHMGVRAVTSINTVAYTDATPTAAELVPKIYDAIQKIQTNRKMPADLIVMHPRRAAWLASNLSSTFPLFQLGSLDQAAGTQAAGFVGNFAGLAVVIDSNIATNYSVGGNTDEDEIYVMRAADMILWESDTRAEVFRDVLSLAGTVRLRLYGYSAFGSERYPTGITKLAGSGLAAPTF